MKVMKKIFMVIIGVIVGFIILHITPSLAIRTHLFVVGHPVAPFVIKVKYNKGQTSQDEELLEKENSKIYYIDGDVKYNATGANMFNFKVKKYGFLYFAETYGEA